MKSTRIDPTFKVDFEAARKATLPEFDPAGDAERREAYMMGEEEPIAEEPSYSTAPIDHGSWC
jgi:hypothetical protein